MSIGAVQVTALRRANLLAQVLLAVPALSLVGIALLAIVLSLTGSNDDPHGFATAIALVLGAVASVPLLLYLRLIRRWWLGGRWVALALADVGLLACAVWLFIANYSPGAPWVAAVYGGLAGLGPMLVVSDGSRTRRAA